MAAENEGHEAIRAVSGALSRIAPAVAEDQDLSKKIVQAIHVGSVDRLAELIAKASGGQVDVGDVEIMTVAKAQQTTVTVTVGVTFGGFTIGLQFSYTKSSK